MSRKLVLAATAVLTLGAAPQVAAAQAVSPSSSPPAEAPAVRRPATEQERAAYERADPLARSVFWAREQEINPADPVAGVRLAQALRELGRHDRAAETAEGVLVTQPGNVEAMLEAGRAHIARGQAFYGIRWLEQARATAPQDWRALSLLGVAYEQVRRHEDAAQAWADGLAVSPENPVILSNMAMARLAAGDAAGAEPLLRRATAQPGATLQMRQNLALALGLTGRQAEAERILRRDLPPELAERNLDWLRRQTGAASAGAAPGGGRTWDSLTGN